MKTTREEIIDKAATLFMQRGYHDVPVKDIAAEVNINPSGLFFHFKNKEEIYKCVVEKYVVNAMDIRSSFGNCDTMTLRIFLDHYIVCIKKRMKALNFIVKLKENTARAYYAFMLECSATDKRYGESILKFDNDEILLWTSVIERAQKNGEIRSDINSFQMAKIFKRSFVGTSYTETYGKGISIPELTELFDNMYALVKV